MFEIRSVAAQAVQHDDRGVRFAFFWFNDFCINDMRLRRGFRAESLNDIRTGFNGRTAEQINTVGYCRKNTVNAFGRNAFQSFSDSLGLPRKVNDQSGMIFDFAKHADLAGQNRGRNKGKRNRTHLFSESRKGTSGDSQRGFRRHVTTRRTGASGCQNQIAVFLITQFFQSRFDKLLFIRNEFFHNFIVRKQSLSEPFF